MEKKKCPFCGENKAFQLEMRGRKGWFAFIECASCGARSGTDFAGRGEKPYYGLKDITIPWSKWNKRVYPGSDEEVAEIANILDWFDDFALVLSTDCGLTDGESDLFGRKRRRLREILYSVLSDT